METQQKTVTAYNVWFEEKEGNDHGYLDRTREGLIEIFPFVEYMLDFNRFEIFRDTQHIIIQKVEYYDY